MTVGRFWPVLFAAALWAAPAGGATHRFSGYAETKGFAYSERATDQDPWVLGWATLLLKEEARIGQAQATASLRAEEISSEERGPLVFDPADREPRRSPVSLRELWVRVPVSSVDLKVGRFELGWGKTDGYSPADAFLPRDLSDPFADEKLPFWGVRITGQRGDLRFEGVGCPITTPWRLPVLGSRNAPVREETPFGPVVIEDDGGTAPRDGFGALRLLATVGDWDLGAWGRAGVRPAPLLVFRQDEARLGSGGVIVPAERRYVREQAYGVELSRVTGSWVLRGEGAFLFSDDGDLGDALIWTLGAERSFGDGSLLVTYADNARSFPADPLLLFDRAILPAIIAAWNQTEAWGGWKIVWAVGLDHGDGLVKAEVSDNLTDSWRITVGFDYPYGSHQGPFGYRDEARRVHAALRWSW